MNTDFGRYGVSAVAFNSGEPVADTLASLHTIKCFFYHYFRILPQNPHYISSREYFNEL